MGSAFSFYHNTPAKEAPSLIDVLTDEELRNLINGTGDDHTLNIKGEEVLTWRITHDAMAKVSFFPTEVDMMTYVSSHTSIPIPKFRRAISCCTGEEYFGVRDQFIVMDYIDGITLQDAWPQMSWWKRLCVMWTIRGYIRQLQKVPLPNNDLPGPFDATGKNYKCWGYYFTAYCCGPFKSYLDMAAWFDQRRLYHLALKYDIQPNLNAKDCSKFDTSHPLVLCHMDLHARNIIVDRKGKIWIIDWAWAGAYPAWLEYAHMIHWTSLEPHQVRSPRIWSSFIWFMVGNYGWYKTGYLDNFKQFWESDMPPVDLPEDYFSERGLSID